MAAAAAAATLSQCSFLPTLTCMKPNPKRKPINPLLFPNSYKPISFSTTNPRSHSLMKSLFKVSNFTTSEH